MLSHIEALADKGVDVLFPLVKGVGIIAIFADVSWQAAAEALLLSESGCTWSERIRKHHEVPFAVLSIHGEPCCKICAVLHETLWHIRVHELHCLGSSRKFRRVRGWCTSRGRCHGGLGYVLGAEHGVGVESVFVCKEWIGGVGVGASLGCLWG